LVSLVGVPVCDARASLSLLARVAVRSSTSGSTTTTICSSVRPKQGQVWVYENLGDGLPATPSLVLQTEAKSSSSARR
jgi:hypothetical protein